MTCCLDRWGVLQVQAANPATNGGSDERLLKSIIAKKLRQKVEQSVRNCNNFSTENTHDQHQGYFDDDVYFYTIENTRKQAFSN